MRKNRVELEEAENGLTVRVWNHDEVKDEYGYCEPEIYVAKTLEEAMTIIKDEFSIDKDKKGEA